MLFKTLAFSKFDLWFTNCCKAAFKVFTFCGGICLIAIAKVYRNYDVVI